MSMYCLFIVLKDLPGLFKITNFLDTLSVQVALQQLLQQPSVISFVSLKSGVGCLTGDEHRAWGWTCSYNQKDTVKMSQQGQCFVKFYRK